MSILSRLFILVAIAVLPALAMQAYAQFDLRREREREIRENALRLATFAAGQVDRIIEGGAGLLAALARLPAVRSRDSAACSAYFAELKQSHPQYRVIGATDIQGRAFCASTDIPPGFSLSDRPYWRQAIQTGGFTVGVYNVGVLAKGPILPLSLAFRDESRSDRRAGLSVARSRMAGTVFCRKALRRRRDHRHRRPQRHNIAAIAGQSKISRCEVRVEQRSVCLRTRGRHRRNNRRGRSAAYPWLHSDRRPATPDLFVGIGIARDAAFADLNRTTTIGFALLTAGLLLALAAAWIGGRQFISQPISRLAEAASHWRKGNFAVRVEPRGGGEIALLGGTFNDMAAELADRQQENATLLATLEQRVGERTLQLAREAEGRRKTEDALYQSQKMEAVGQLTGGIAHDFNNLLTAVIGNLELAELRLGGSGADRALRHIADARRSAERGARLTKDLLAFARKQSLRIEEVDLNAVVQSAGDLLHRSVGPTVRIDLRLEPHPWPALADPRQMELVILNLSINARDAMSAGGTITIETSNIAAGDPQCPAGVPAGDYVLLAVSDTGSGMAPEVLAKCLEPFFTTKEIGRGSGLGLSVVHGVATQSGGTVEIRSQVGHGTCVRVYLPRADAEPASDAASTVSGSRTPCDGPLAAHVLLVDDDDQVRQVIAAQLTELGCSVTEASTGRVALDLLDDPSTPSFDLLISDYAMPGISGTSLARSAQGQVAGLAVLLITGYNDPRAEIGGSRRVGLADEAVPASRTGRANPSRHGGSEIDSGTDRVISR